MDSITNSMDMSLSKLREMVKDREAWPAVVHAVRVGHNLATEQQRKYVSGASQVAIVVKDLPANTGLSHLLGANSLDKIFRGNGGLGWAGIGLPALAAPLQKAGSNGSYQITSTFPGTRASLVIQVVKKLPAMQETCV